MHVRSLHASSALGTSLAVRVRGTGPALLLCNGWSTSDFFWKHMLPTWTTRYTVVSWDYPGHGASEPARGNDDVQVDALAEDAVRVMDAAGVRRAAIVGYSMGCQVALQTAALATDRAAAVVPLLGSFEHMIGTATLPSLGRAVGTAMGALPSPVAWGMHRAVWRVMRSPAGMPLGRVLGMVGPDATAADVGDYVEHFGRVHPPSVFATAAAGQRHSARDALARIEAPVFVVTGDDDSLAPPHRAGALLHELLPGSRLARLPAGTHTSLFEHHEEIAILVDDFLLEIGFAGDSRYRRSA